MSEETVGVFPYESLPAIPKLIAFDLDGTLWRPEMYELWGGGAPFSKVKNSNDLVDSAGVRVRLLGVSGDILQDLKSHPLLQNVIVAWVSTTDEPDWAKECLQKFATSGGVPLSSVVHSPQIFKANKQVHFQNLKKQYPDIRFEEMLFFDNEWRNIRDVQKLGVKCYHCEDGMTLEAWAEGLKAFQNS